MIKNYKKTKAQGALEYLLIIAGALLVAVVVILLVSSTSRNSTNQAKNNSEDLSKLIDNTIIPPIITYVDCNIDNNVMTIIINPPQLGMNRFLIKVDNQIPKPTDGTFYTSNSNNIIYANTNTFGIDTLNQSYDISLIALKNNSRSRPSQPPMSCIAHN